MIFQSYIKNNNEIFILSFLFLYLLELSVANLLKSTFFCNLTFKAVMDHSLTVKF